MRAVFFWVFLASVDFVWGLDTQTFDGDARDFAVGKNFVYVVSNKQLYQLNHNLTTIAMKDWNEFHTKDESPYTVNILLPFIKNQTLITCGIKNCGYCEILDLNNISKTVHTEDIGVVYLNPNNSIIGLIVEVDKASFIMVGMSEDCKPAMCLDDYHFLVLRNAQDGQNGGLFSHSDAGSTPYVKNHEAINFVDVFQISTHIYLFSNVLKDPKVRLIWFNGTISKSYTLKSLRGVTLSCCDDMKRPQLLSSSVIPSPSVPEGKVLWAGVFTGDEPPDSVKTVLAIYDISPFDKQADQDPDFCFEACKGKFPIQPPPDLKPLSVVFKYRSMTSVLAERHNSWIVFFIGTEDGQLIKLAMDKNYKRACPRVLYKSADDRRVFPKMHLDPVDRKHVYMLMGNQMMRVPVAQCSEYKRIKDCWLAQDPYCGWCASESRCSFLDECLQSSIWISIPDDYQQQRIVSYQVEKNNSDEKIKLTVEVHLNVIQKEGSDFPFACNFASNLCDTNGEPAVFPKCRCLFPSDKLSAKGLDVNMKIRMGKAELSENLMLTNCSDIIGPPSFALCSRCMTAGCSWNNNTCSWSRSANIGPVQDICRISQLVMNNSELEIISIEPAVLSFYGWNHALMKGTNLDNVVRVKIQWDSCLSHQSPVWNHTGTSLTFHLPSGDKGSFSVCAELPDGRCLGNATVTYQSSPTCTGLSPAHTWASGSRIYILGAYPELVEGAFQSQPSQIITTHFSSGKLWYHAPPYDLAKDSTVTTNVSLRVANQTLACSSQLTYYPDPQFTSFTTARSGNDLRVTIEKKADKINITLSEISVRGALGENRYVDCVVKAIETSNSTDSIICEMKDTLSADILSLEIRIGSFTKTLKSPFSPLVMVIILVIAIILAIISGVSWHSYIKQRKMAARMNQRLEQLECDIRIDIRQGFVDMQLERCDLVENVGAIPFLDYKHFASRIFFPDGGPLMTSCINDIGQDTVKVQPDMSCQVLSRLIRDQVFLTTFVHTLEEQRNFHVKEKCAVASLLTVALHDDLPYLTEVMGELLVALMEQHSNSQAKLMLRRTQSIVEKMLTNWMSICLYGFLRESVGQHLYLLVCALTHQMSKGPVDSVTEKALYTLNEDWLLWQAQDFSAMRLQVLFAVGTDGEVSEPLEVSALDCDTVDQVKEKILLAFKVKFGFPYNTLPRDIDIKYETDGNVFPLEEVDASSKVIGDVTMLNTLQHYKVPDGASIIVLPKTHPPLSPQRSLKEDQDYSIKYFHLIDPDIEDNQMGPERKKLKLKEVYLTKLLSTKVAVHSFVENLFQAIWGTTNLKAPPAVKYFFDFLDAQAENKRIIDPDVLHIWKTNSLPLRFWVNILKNPQFVFDMEKTPPLDGCLSVIAQAFMDSFSLGEKQLGKHDPTNKLLYAKDIPQYKKEVRNYYKQVRNQASISGPAFREYLREESKKHEHEFNESAALRELYKYLQKYFEEVKSRLKMKLESSGSSMELMEQLQHVKSLFDGLKTCSWN